MDKKKKKLRRMRTTPSVEEIAEVIKLSCISQLYLLKHKEVDEAINDMNNLAEAIHALIVGKERR